MAAQSVTVTGVSRGGKTFSTVVQLSDPVVEAAGFPDASTTGARGTLRAWTGSDKLTANNAVYEGYIFSGQTESSGSNVTFRNCKFTCQSYWPLRVTGGGLIDHCTFVNGNDSQCSVDLGKTTTIQFCDVTGAGDGIRGTDGVTILDNWVHPTGPSDAHRDAIDVEGTAGNVVIRHNRIEVYSNQTSCITIENDAGGGKWDNILVENNWLAGAGFVFYTVSKTPITNMRIINNTLSRKFFPNYGYGGTVYKGWPGGATNVWAGNRDADTGAIVN